MGAKASRVRMTGPLMAYAPGFASALTRAGYTENATADQVRLLAHLSRWLAAQGLGAADLTPEVGDAFLAARPIASSTDPVSVMTQLRSLDTHAASQHRSG
jgi:hypothetical protein